MNRPRFAGQMGDHGGDVVCLAVPLESRRRSLLIGGIRRCGVHIHVDRTGLDDIYANSAGPRSRARPRVVRQRPPWSWSTSVTPGPATRSPRQLPMVMMRPPSFMCRIAA